MAALSLGPYGTNCYVCADDRQETALVVDPGDDADLIRRALRELRTRCAAILVTHGHTDHIGGVGPIARSGSIPVYMPADECVYLERINDFLYPGLGPYEPWTPDRRLAGDERFREAGLDVRTIPVPGHSPAAVAYLVTGADGDQALFVGDAIFAGSVGRTDLPGASWDVLERSLDRLVDEVGPDVPVLPGHGPPTTLGRELESNPFLEAVRRRRGTGAA